MEREGHETADKIAAELRQRINDLNVRAPDGARSRGLPKPPPRPLHTRAQPPVLSHRYPPPQHVQLEFETSKALSEMATSEIKDSIARQQSVVAHAVESAVKAAQDSMQREYDAYVVW